MIAKTQFRIDQFVTKLTLRKLLQRRSACKRVDAATLSLDEKEFRAELDYRIKQTRDLLETNKSMISQKTRRSKREAVAA